MPRKPAAAAVLILALLAPALTATPVAGAVPEGQRDRPAATVPLERFGPGPTDNVALRWGEQALVRIRVARPAPTVVSRVLAVVQTAVYDAWAAYDPVAVGTRLGGRLRRPAAERTATNKGTAISFAAYRTLTDLFPAQAAELRQFMVGMGHDPDDTSTDPSTPAGVGNLAAAAVLDFRHRDGANQLGDRNNGAPYSDYTGYTPVNSPDQLVDPLRWQPLRVNGQIQVFSTPHWNLVEPFALTSASQFAPPGPDLRRDPGYRRAAADIVRLSAELDDRSKSIAEYWADGPGSELPPGHWALLAHALARIRGYSLDQTVKLLFVQANAVLDAGIASWDSKVRVDWVRPISLIRFLYEGRRIHAWGGPGQGTRVIAGETWQPYQLPTVVTPPFAEYVSGHSTFSAASAAALRAFTGSDRFGVSVTIPAGSSRIEPGITPAADVTLRWPTFDAAADEAGISRRYGGIHFADGDFHGRQLGSRVGAAVFAKARTYFDGSAGPGR